MDAYVYLILEDKLLNELDIKDAIEKFDHINRPYIVYCHPDDRKIIETIKDVAVIEETYYLKSGKILIVNRESIENYYKDLFDDFVDVKNIVDQEDISNEL